MWATWLNLQPWTKANTERIVASHDLLQPGKATVAALSGQATPFQAPINRGWCAGRVREGESRWGRTTRMQALRKLRHRPRYGTKMNGIPPSSIGGPHCLNSNPWQNGGACAWNGKDGNLLHFQPGPEEIILLLVCVLGCSQATNWLSNFI